MPPALVCALLMLPLLGGCSWPWQHGGGADKASVFDAKIGDCFESPTEVQAQISDLQRVDCAKPHGQEAYALPAYKAADGSDTFPGDEVLESFAQAACAQAFGPYVGVDYLDSALYDTYLLPSPRSWQDGDRTVLCLATDSGQSMVGSVKGTKR